MNSVELIGRLTRDPDIKCKSDGTAVASFILAVDRDGKKDIDGKKLADFIRVVTFGSQAETVEKYIKKGRWLAIQGRIQTGSYTDRNDETVYTTDVVANRVEFVPDGQGAQSQRNDTGYTTRATQTQVEIPRDTFENVDEDIPF